MDGRGILEKSDMDYGCVSVLLVREGGGACDAVVEDTVDKKLRGWKQVVVQVNRIIFLVSSLDVQEVKGLAEVAIRD